MCSGATAVPIRRRRRRKKGTVTLRVKGISNKRKPVKKMSKKKTERRKKREREKYLGGDQRAELLQ